MVALAVRAAWAGLASVAVTLMMLPSPTCWALTLPIPGAVCAAAAWIAGLVITPIWVAMSGDAFPPLPPAAFANTSCPLAWYIFVWRSDRQSPTAKTMAVTTRMIHDRRHSTPR